MAATPLMRVSIFTTVFAGIIGAIVFQMIFGQGGLQFGVGMVAGYLAYFGYLMRTMGEPRVIGVMAVLTPKKVVLLGSRRAGIVGEYDIADIESLEMVRKGNILIMGKLALSPSTGDKVTFMTSNRQIAAGFVAEFEEIRRRGFRG